MGERDALREPGRPGRVAQRRDVVEIDGCPVDLRRVLAIGGQVVPAEDPRGRRTPAERRGRQGSRDGTAGVEDPWRSDQQRLRTTRFKDRVDLVGWRRGVQRHGHRTEETHRDLERDVPRSVRSDDRDVRPAADADPAEAPRGGEHVGPHVGRRPWVPSAVDDVEVADREPPAPEPEHRLLVHGPSGTVQESSRYREPEQGGQVRLPTWLVRSEQPIRVVAPERAPFMEVRHKDAETGRRTGQRHARQREHDRPREPYPELRPRPRADRTHDLARGRQRCPRRRQMHGASLGARVVEQPHDRIGDVVDRHDVHPQSGAHGHDMRALREVVAKRQVEGVERRDLAGSRVADDHGRAHHGDREGGHLLAHEPFRLVLRPLVVVLEAEPVAEVVLADLAAAAAGHVRRRDVEQPLEPVIRVNRSSERERVRRSPHVRPAQVLERCVEADGRGRVHDVREPADERRVGVRREPERRMRHIARHDLDPASDRVGKLPTAVPGPACLPERRIVGRGLHQADERQVAPIEEADGDLGPDEPGRTRQQDYAAHGTDPHPCAFANPRSSSRFRRASRRCRR